VNSNPRPVAFSLREYVAIDQAADCLWWKAFLRLSYTTGMRVGEVLRLHESDVNVFTKSIRISAQPIVGELTLRRPMPVYQERVIPVGESTLSLLSELRDERPKNSHVFVPDWKLAQLWTSIASGEALTAEQISPGFGQWFRMIQRRARQVHADNQGVSLEEIEWPIRGVRALRTTAIIRLSERMTPRALAEHLGYPSARSVLRYYDLATSRDAGWRR